MKKVAHQQVQGNPEGSRRVVILAVLFIIALAFLGYFVFSKESGSKAEKGLRGPTGEPFVNGPSGPPPGANY